MLLDSGKDDVSNVDKVLWILGGEAKGENKP
jgi:UDP-N-acetylmuramoylalanine-D-glutamate ligase